MNKAIVHYSKGIHPLDIPIDALTTVTWWDVMCWTADILDTFLPHSQER